MPGLSRRPYLIWALGGILCSIPFAALAGFVVRYGVNLPYSDQWEFVLLFIKARGPGLEFSDLFGQHGEHRIFFPRLVMLALAPLTSWNIRAELLVNLLLVAGIFAVLTLLMVRTLKPLGPWLLVPAAVLSLMIFSPVQWENWLWGWQISWFLPLFLFVSAAAVLWLWPDERRVWPPMAIAIAAAIAGQYSLLGATLIWVTCLILFVARDRIRKYWWIWAGCGAMSTLAYLKDYRRPAAMEHFHMRPSLLLEEPERPIAYLLYLLGRPVLDEEPGYLPGGLFLVSFLLVTAYLVFFRPHRLREVSVWLVIGFYALGTGLLTTAGRVGLGLDLAGSSRYTTIGILFMAATAALITFAVIPDAKPVPSSSGGSNAGPEPGMAAASTLARRTPVFVLLALWVSIGGLYLADYGSEVKAMKKWHTERLQIRQCLLVASSPQDPCVVAAYPAPQAIFERAQFLKSIGWGGLDVDHPGPPK